MMKRFYLEDHLATNVSGTMMNPAEGIFCGAVSSTNKIDDEVVWNETKKVGGVKKVKPGGEKLKGAVIDVENCLYLIWSPHHKETYLGM